MAWGRSPATSAEWELSGTMPGCHDGMLENWSPTLHVTTNHANETLRMRLGWNITNQSWNLNWSMTSFKGPVPAGRKKKSIVHFLWHPFLLLAKWKCLYSLPCSLRRGGGYPSHLPILTPPSCGDRWTHAESFLEGSLSRHCWGGHLSDMSAITASVPRQASLLQWLGPNHALCYHWLLRVWTA